MSCVLFSSPFPLPDVPVGFDDGKPDINRYDLLPLMSDDPLYKISFTVRFRGVHLALFRVYFKCIGARQSFHWRKRILMEEAEWSIDPIGNGQGN
jgi:hypothetical protein